MNTKNQDIRWHQRLASLLKALKQLNEAIDLQRQRPFSNIERQGLIKVFEFTHELAWNVMKDFFDYQGTVDIMGSRDATREACDLLSPKGPRLREHFVQKGLISDGSLWMEMIKSRKLSSHTYNDSTAKDIANKISNDYIESFNRFAKKMSDLKDAGK